MSRSKRRLNHNDLNADTITQNVIALNSGSPNERLGFILERLVLHLHDFVRETRLTSQEWMEGLLFLTKTGQTCTPLRQEFILLSDILGLSLLVDSIDHPKPANSTQGSLLGPFHTHDANTMSSGDRLSSDPKGEDCLVLCTVKDVEGQPLEGVKIDIWETDSSGHYDTQYEDRAAPDGRAVMTSDDQGRFWFKAIKPVSYPIPHDGPVGKLLASLGRHPWRPAHMHFMFKKPGYDELITALFLRGDPYETSDAVFGVKESLLVDLDTVSAEMATMYGVPEGSYLLKHDFVLVTEQAVRTLKDENARRASASFNQGEREAGALRLSL
ncbi:uncharacterized protein Z520_03659 [Fonsecaea multimorphosa CBS 102226]|uniref:Intradiol ring-cleavage dioxygenases domain-containing protein n=1 Tax=Fonsecaea multimorphosa CBS 102226 TaxID=1442371 RepID=A0A0D2K5C7_9EURO|nr:uncharacterized protein Z520_03659 [Fonsecaea multimorphosa CBS 102226]KIY00993.1 hypothetical protein Z520_03659 [Fonsecaea multimorphosa CBS 102226]OAL27577.1 hypothetical protein AYO22_03481 [Fonsecaea multimorphosa]